MEDPRAKRLSRLGLDASVAGLLVVAGFDTPRKIKAATNKELESVKGIGKSARTIIKKRFPKAG